MALLRRIFSTEEKRTLMRNFMSLSTIQAFSYALPLLILPYVVRMVGAERFGVAAYALAIAAFFTVLTDYGFNLTATREASIHRQDIQRLSELYSTVMAIKSSLLLLGAGLLFLILHIFENLGKDSLVFWSAYTVVAGQVLFPAWFYQGLERMRTITLFSVTTRGLAALAVFPLVKGPEDLFWVPALQGLGGMVAGVLGIAVAWKSLGLRLVKPNSVGILTQLKTGWPVFISNLGINTYINSNIVILGIFANSTAVGFYSVAEKLVSSVRGVSVVLFQSIYPRACLRAHQGTSLYFFYRTIMLWSGIAFAMIGVVLMVGAPWIVTLVSGELMPRAVWVLQILAFVPLIVLFNGPPYQMLLIKGRRGPMSAVLLFGAAFNMGLNAYMSAHYAEVGTAIAVLVTEILITASLYAVYLRGRIMAIFQVCRF